MATHDDKSVKKPALLRLSDTDLKIAHSAEDIRGRKVVDKDGKEIGDVDDLMIDDLERKVRFIEIASGGFLGIGETKFLIPVDAIIKITDDAVHINRTREYIAGAPRYNPDLVDERYLANIYKYYENPTEWGPDPPYPSPRL